MFRKHLNSFFANVIRKNIFDIQSVNFYVVLFQAFKVLAVKHIRRIYDITNVLEGIGLIVKISKRHVKWV